MNNEKVTDSEAPAATGFYEMIPRFVYDLPELDENNFLPEIEREFECKGQKFCLTIVPALMMKRTIEGLSNNVRDLLPGPNEEQLEKAFRRLAIKSNINFDAENYILCFSFAQILREYATIADSQKLNRNQLENSLSIFLDSKYFLKQGEIEYYFGPIEEYKWVEIDDEVYYLVRFTAFFFNRSKLFNQSFNLNS